MFIHIIESPEAKVFLENCGLYLTNKSCHNMIVLKNNLTGEELTIWAESDSSIAAGIPGLYVDTNSPR